MENKTDFEEVAEKPLEETEFGHFLDLDMEKKLKKKSKTNKEIVKIGFNEEKAPILNIKSSKKVQQMPQESPILKQEITTNAEGKEKTGMSDTRIEIKELEQELKDKKKLLKQKKKEETERLAKEEAEKLQKELAEKDKQEQKIEETAIEPEQKFLLTPDNANLFEVCPICQAKVKKSFVKKQGIALIQNFKCKNKLCNFRKGINLKI